MVDLLQLPELVLRRVLLFLDGTSLHRCRQVCHDWNWAVMDVWRSTACRSVLKRQLNIRWKRARPWLQPLVSTFTLPEKAACPGSTLQLLGMDENGVVVRCTSSSSPVRTWAEEIKLMVVERDKHWEVGITPSDKSEIFYRAEITKTMVAAVTDLGTVAVWHRATKQLIHCRQEPVAECSLSLRASGDLLLIWNEMEATFLLLRWDGDAMVELSKVTSGLSDTYILHLQPPHFLTESGAGVHLWNLSDPRTPFHSLHLDTFGLELGVVFHPFCALTMSTNVVNWHDGWTVQVWNFETHQCVRRLPGAGYITDIRLVEGNLVLSRKVGDAPCIVIYSTNDLVSPDQSPAERLIPVEKVSTKIAASSTSIHLVDFDATSVILTSWNFWTSPD